MRQRHHRSGTSSREATRALILIVAAQRIPRFAIPSISAMRGLYGPDHPRPYEGDASDAELPLLAACLRTLKSELNVRSIEKRRWRDVVRRVGGIEGVV